MTAVTYVTTVTMVTKITEVTRVTKINDVTAVTIVTKITDVKMCSYSCIIHESSRQPWVASLGHHLTVFLAKVC